MTVERGSLIGLLALAAGLAVSAAAAFGLPPSAAPASQSSNSSGQTSANQTGTGQAGAATSPADAARKARELKKQQPKPAHVWDDDNLPKEGGLNVVGQPEIEAAPANVAPPIGGRQGQGGPPAAAPTPAPMPAKEQSQVQSAIQEERDKIADLKKDIDVAQRKFSLDSDMYYGKPDYAGDRDGKRALDTEQAGLKDKQQQLEQAQQELALLEAKLSAAVGAAKP